MNCGVIGIDFGSNNSVVGIAKKGVISIATNDFSNRKTPTIVAYTDEKRQVGDEAAFAHSRNYVNTIYNFKRILGCNTGDKSVIKHLSSMPYKTKINADGKLKILPSLSNKTIELDVESIAATYLLHLKKSTEKTSKVPVEDTVISVPCDAPISTRNALLDSAKIAGLNVIGLVNELTAVAIGYGLEKKSLESSRTVLFIDVGHSAISLSLVEFDSKGLKNIKSARNANFGSEAYEDKLFHFTTKEIMDLHRLDVNSNKKACIRLLSAVRKAKRILSSNKDARIHVECLMNDTDVTINISRQTFEELTLNITQGIIQFIENFISGENAFPLDKIHSIEIVGGGSHMPLLKQSMEKILRRPLSFTCDPSESIAKGCALRCAMLSPLFRVKEYAIADCFPYSISISWGPIRDDYMAENCPFDEVTELFPAFSSTPSARLISFKQIKPLQVVIKYSKNNPSSVSGQFISRYLIHPLDPSPALEGYRLKSAKIQLKIALTHDGLITPRSIRTIEEFEIEKESEKSEETNPQSLPSNSSSNPNTNDENNSESNMKNKKSKTDASLDKKVIKRDMEMERIEQKLSGDEIQFAKEMEKTFEMKESEIQKRCELRNELESIVITFKSQLENEFRDFVPEEKRRAMVTQMENLDQWLYSPEGDDAEMAKYETLLNSAQEERRAIDDRKREWTNFHSQLPSLKTLSSEYSIKMKKALESEKEYSHLTRDDLSLVQKTIQEANEWISRAERRRSECPKHENFDIPTAEIRDWMANMRKECDSVFDKPKPEPKKESQERGGEEK